MNKYQILQKIGQGEYGVILKAQNKQTQQLVAIKKFKEDDQDQQNKKIILRQVKVLKTMHHQNITQLKQAFRKKGKVYIVCQYVQKNLLQIIQENNSLDSYKIKNYLTQLLKGLQYMHNLNLIHRDLKPQNLLINSDHTLKICDFGFARTVPTSGKMTDYVATRWYRAPQLLLGRDDYDKSVDIWATGCIFSQMISCQPLFPGQSDIDQLYLMQRCLGQLCSDHQQFFLKNPKFVGMKFPEFNSMESLERKFIGKIQKDGLDLLKKMLKMNPKQRITASEALKHPYFSKSKLIENLSGNYQKTDGNIINFKNIGLIQEHKFNNKQQRIGLNKVTGINKIKLMTGEQTKSKLIHNIKNKANMNPNIGNQKKIILNQDKLIRKQQFEYVFQKKPRSPKMEQQVQKKVYLPDFEQQQRIETPKIKSRQNYIKRKKLGNMQDYEQINNNQQGIKTPVLTKLLIKKKISKLINTNEQQIQKRKKLLKQQVNNKLFEKQKQSIKLQRHIVNNEDEFEYIGLNNFKKKDVQGLQQNVRTGNYNIIFNQNTFNYNFGKK